MTLTERTGSCLAGGGEQADKPAIAPKSRKNLKQPRMEKLSEVNITD
jgi:hypothetical protein